MTRPNRPLARTLTQRLIMIAAGIVALNIAVVGVYYGSDRRALEAEVIADVTARLGEALDGTQLPVDARARDIFAEYPESYAFAFDLPPFSGPLVSRVCSSFVCHHSAA